MLSRNNKNVIKKKNAEDHAEDALYREVWEEVNAQKTYDFVRAHSRWLIAGAIVILIATVGYQIYRTHAHESNAIAAEKFESAMAMSVTEKPEVAAEALRRAANAANGGTADLALFQSAMMSLSAHNTADADKKLSDLARDGNSRDFRDLATLRLAMLRADSMKAADLEKFLAPLQTEKSPFYYTGMLILGQKYLSDGDRAHANTWFDKIINDKNAPNSIKTTAESLK